MHIHEFYLYAGKYLEDARTQRDYISTSYTHVVRDLLARGVNVLAQQLAKRTIDGRPMLSLSCNPDLTPDLMRGLAASGRPYATVAQVNDRLPFMYGDAVVPQRASAHRGATPPARVSRYGGGSIVPDAAGRVAPKQSG